MPTILLIRHGESLSNARKPTSCPKFVELTENGKKQAEAIAQHLQEAQLIPDLIVTSSYFRTKLTAEPTGLVFPSTPKNEWPVHEFTYLSSWHDHISTIEERQPAVEAYWELADPEYVDDPKPGSPESESFKQFIKRVLQVREYLQNTELNSIAIFSHEQFITAFRWLSESDFLQITSESMQEFRTFLKANPVPNGAIVQAQRCRGYDNWRYKMITSHLENLQPVIAE